MRWQPSARTRSPGRKGQKSRFLFALTLALLILMTCSPVLVAALAPGQETPPPADPAASLRRFWLMIALPGLLIGGTAMILVILYAARVRRRKLERGELPEMPD